jgi:hypothetical protein
MNIHQDRRLDGYSLSRIPSLKKPFSFERGSFLHFFKIISYSFSVLLIIQFIKLISFFETEEEQNEI